MKVTFMVGNGFDISLGMKTKFTDMYDGYVTCKSKSQAIENFKNFLKLTSENNYKNWGNFETTMARHAKNFSNEDDFIECVRDFKDYMAAYLQSEQEKFFKGFQVLTKEEICFEWSKSLSAFYEGVTPNVTASVNAIKKATPLIYTFVDFNYTEVLDEIMKAWDNSNPLIHLSTPIHIHGKLSGDIVLGVDSGEQFGETSFPITKRVGLAFVKPALNASYDTRRVSAAKSAISDSDVICVYGMSFGPSDYTWSKELCKWLKANPNHHLFYYGSSKEKFSNEWIGDAILEEEEKQKGLLLNKLCEKDEDINMLFDQVHIPLRKDIFRYKKIIDYKRLENAKKKC